MLRQKDVRNFMWLPRYDLNIHQIQWISFFELRNFITSCTCSSNLKYAKKFNKMKKKLMKYTKKFKITLNLRKEFQIMWDDFTKKWGKKTKNKKILPRVPHPSTQGRDPSPSARMRHSGKRLASPSVKVRHSGKRLASPSVKVRHSGKRLASPSAKEMHSGRVF
jgi:hypothetical protein